MKNKSAYEYAIFLLGKFSYTEKALIEKLNSKNFTEKEIYKTIKTLKEHKYINDNEYAYRFVEKMIDKCFGKNYILLRLKEKGIQEQTAEKTFNLLLKEKHLTEYDIALKIIKKKSNYKPEKVVRLIKSRGFSQEVIDRIVYKFFNH